MPQRGGDGDDGVQGKAARAEGQRVQGTVGADGVGDGHARAEDQGVVAACGKRKMKKRSATKGKHCGVQQWMGT